MDAKGASRLYQSRIHKRDLFFLVAAAIIFLVTLLSARLRRVGGSP